MRLAWCPKDIFDPLLLKYKANSLQTVIYEFNKHNDEGRNSNTNNNNNNNNNNMNSQYIQIYLDNIEDRCEIMF